MMFIIGEGAMRYLLGFGESTARRQIETLKEFSTRPNVSIQLLPFSVGPNPGLTGPFTILELSNPYLSNIIVHLETQGETTLTDDETDAGNYLDDFKALQGLAIQPDDLAEFLDALQAFRP